MAATTRITHPTLPEPPALYAALELSNRSWKLAFSTGLGHKPRIRAVPARDLDALEREIASARARFGLDDSVPLITCYEAGRDGFWIHRFLTSQPGRHNLVVDSASIDVKRRHRRLKTDRIALSSSSPCSSAITTASPESGPLCTYLLPKPRMRATSIVSFSRSRPRAPA